MWISIFVVISLFSGVAFGSYTKECLSQADCGPDECCVLRMQRYSIPVCEPLGQMGDNCLMYNQPEDKDLSYPNRFVKAYGLYRLFCPCASPFYCKGAKCSLSENEVFAQ